VDRAATVRHRLTARLLIGMSIQAATGRLEPDRHRAEKLTHPAPGGFRRRLTVVPRMVWMITALWVSLLLGASVLWPMLFGYDEPAHVDMAYLSSTHPFRFYGPGQLTQTRASTEMQGADPRYPKGILLFGMAQLYGHRPVPRPQRLSMDDLGGSTPVPGTQANQMVQHPPLYYWLEGAVLRLPGVSQLAWDLQVWLMRLASVAMLTPMPILCWAATRRLAGGVADIMRVSANSSSRLATLAAVVPLTVPNLIRDGSAVNNDALLILVTSVVLYLLSRVVTGDLSIRTAGGVAVALAAALWTKGFALVLPPVVLAAYLVGGWPAGSALRARLRVLWRPLAIAAAGALAGSFWWVRNVIRYHTVQTSGHGPGFDRTLFGAPDNHGGLATFIPQYLTLFVSRIWGGIGLIDAPSPGPFIEYGWFFIVLICIIAALLLPPEKRARGGFAVLISATVLSVLVDAAGSFSTFRHWSLTVQGAQGRYIYQTVVAIAALTAIGLFELLRPRVLRHLIALGLVAAVLTNGAAWLLLLRTVYGPPGASFPRGLGGAVRTLTDWSPLPAAVTWLLVIVAPVALSVTTIVMAVRDARRDVGSGRAAQIELAATR
jgi:4-amino-4-deoxy-L-arabinose transferase-like glycosyltransferase